MSRTSMILPLLAAAAALSGCGLQSYRESPDTVIATAWDTGLDKGQLSDRSAAIAYDPDGCQNWLIDDGVEGYSSPRFDPVTGMANVCNNLFPPGAVVGYYQSRGEGISDSVPSAPNRRR